MGYAGSGEAIRRSGPGWGQSSGLRRLGWLGCCDGSWSRTGVGGPVGREGGRQGCGGWGGRRCDGGSWVRGARPSGRRPCCRGRPADVRAAVRAAAAVVIGAPLAHGRREVVGCSAVGHVAVRCPVGVWVVVRGVAAVVVGVLSWVVG